MTRTYVVTGSASGIGMATLAVAGVAERTSLAVNKEGSFERGKDAQTTPRLLSQFSES